MNGSPTKQCECHASSINSSEIVAVLDRLQLVENQESEALMGSLKQAGVSGVKFIVSSQRHYATRQLLEQMDRWWHSGVSYGRLFDEFDSNGKIVDRISRVRDRPKLIVAPYDLQSFSQLPHNDIDTWQIDPACITNIPLLQSVSSVAREVFLCTWGAYPDQILRAASVFEQADLVMIHSLRENSTESLSEDLATLRWLRNSGRRIGCYDSKLNVHPLCLGLSVGVEVIECPLYPISGSGGDIFELSDLAAFIRIVRRLEQIIVHGPYLTYGPDELDSINDVRGTLVAAGPVKKGTILSRDMVTVKAPAVGLEAEILPAILGKRLLYDLKEDDPITFGVLQC